MPQTISPYDYPNDDQVEAFYNDDAAEAAALVELERVERRTRALFDYAHRTVGDIPEDEATDEDLDWVTDTYMAWCKASEALHQARRTGQEA